MRNRLFGLRRVVRHGFFLNGRQWTLFFSCGPVRHVTIMDTVSEFAFVVTIFGEDDSRCRHPEWLDVCNSAWHLKTHSGSRVKCIRNNGRRLG